MVSGCREISKSTIKGVMMKIALYTVALAFIVCTMITIAIGAAQVGMGVVDPNVVFVGTCALCCVFGRYVQVT
jgi:hypothetical protein